MTPKILIAAISILIIVSLTYNIIQKKENNKLAKEVSALNSEISNLEDEKTALESRVAELEDAKENLQSNIEDARDNVDELKNQVDNDYWDKWETERKVHNLEDKVGEMESNNDN